ncbi:glycosyltransferase family 39 protein [Pontibacter sp. G13]|uniref:ArnT family glycosyltransferase n=1 Tax=Pontibacter sp. G13 TaxID=3074898 RepID=UPI0028899768|nr:glycosyltransferase family 39 protein [Pontibacter sp. G13]WNJ16830.1 glycosyltransferase family 39 protein [Pontibacter sp. G13]
MKGSSNIWQDLVAIVFIGLIGFGLFLGAAPLFDWDEINFAESAREMLVTGNFFQVQINYQPFWEKPPLFFWMQALSMKVFGVNEFAARFPNALVGVVTLLALYFTGLRWKDRAFARILVMFYTATMLPVVYFKSGIIDPAFNLFIFLGLVQIFQYDSSWMDDPDAAKQSAAPWGAGGWIGIATLTKGPVALLVAMLVYAAYKLVYHRFRLPWMGVLRFFVAWAIPVLGWYGIETFVHGWWFIDTFIQYQIELFSQNVAGHAQPFYYHILVFLPGCFPMAAFVFRGMREKTDDVEETRMRTFMMIWFWVVLVLFSVVKTKIVHYASLLYFPAVFLAGHYAYQVWKSDRKLPWDVWLILGLGMLVWGVLPAFVNTFTGNLEEIRAAITDPHAKALLGVDAGWSGLEWIIGTLFLAGLLVNIWLLRSRQYAYALALQVGLSLAFINGQYKVVVPKVAQHTQGANMEFFSQLAGRDVYLMTFKYKSYLHYFYGQAKPYDHPEGYDLWWMCNGEVDKDIYLSIKQSKLNSELTDVVFHDFERLYAKGGFVFFRRKKSQTLQAASLSTPENVNMSRVVEVTER